MKSSFKSLPISFAIALVAVICIAIIADRFFFRIDLTDDSVYTLSEGSERIASKIEDQVTISLYFSKSRKDLPPVFKSYGDRIEEVLREYASHSENLITVELIDPKPDSDEEVQARKYGIQGIAMQNGDEAYLGAVFISGDKQVNVPYFDPRKEEMLEYDISEALVKLNQSTKPKIGLYSSLQVDSGRFSPHQSGSTNPEWAFVSGLKQFFAIDYIDDKDPKIADDLSLLIIMHPKSISEAFEYQIDQYLLQGGRIVLMVDPFSRMDMAENSQRAMMQGGQTPQASSNIERLFKAWGVNYDPAKILGDPQRATRISTGVQAVSYPYFISLIEEDISDENLMTANLKQMLFAESGWFAWDDLKEGISATALIESSDETGSVDANMANFMGPQALAAQLKATENKKALAVLLQGIFPSAFSEKPSKIESSKDHLTRSSKEGVVVAVADVDFIHDSNAVDRMRFLNQVIVRPRNDNLNFVLNAVESLGGSQDLISIRKSGRTQRPFTKVIELQQNAQNRWKEEDEKLSQRLNELQAKLRELRSNRSGDNNQALLSGAQQKEIQKFREQEAEVRTQRRKVRQNLREDIESLGRTLIAINLILVPSIISGFGFYVFNRRSKKSAMGGRK